MTEPVTACAVRLSEFTHALRFEMIPHEVRENIALRVLDTVGIALASTREDFAGPVLGLTESWGNGECTVIGSKIRRAVRRTGPSSGSTMRAFSPDLRKLTTLRSAASDRAITRC